MLRKIAREEEEKRRKVWIGHGRIKIDNVWWRQNEAEEMLRDRGNVRVIAGGKERRKKGRRRIRREGGREGEEEGDG